MSTDFAPSQDLPVPTEPDLSPNAITVLEHRYLMRDDDGQVAETPAELFRRVAKAVAEPEASWGARRCRTCSAWSTSSTGSWPLDGSCRIRPP